MSVLYRYSNGKQWGERPDLSSAAIIRVYVEGADSSGYFRCWEYNNGIIERKWCPASGYISEIHEFCRVG